MPTIQKFYFHDATSTVVGTLPGASTQSATTPNVTATGAGTNRVMDGTIGASQTFAVLTTLAQQTLQSNWFRRFISPPLAAQTIAQPNNNWTVSDAVSESSTNSGGGTAYGCCYVWRPGSGTKVGNLWDDVTHGVTGSSTTEIATSGTVPSGTGTSVVCVAGDVLVYELWSANIQSMSTAYTNTIFYDGTTEGSATTNAAYLLSPNALTLDATGGPVPFVNMARQAC
jgi:hypothetical protein